MSVLHIFDGAISVPVQERFETGNCVPVAGSTMTHGSPMRPDETVRLFFAVGAAEDMDMSLLDVSAAFVQEELPAGMKIYMRLPREHFGAERIVELGGAPTSMPLNLVKNSNGGYPGVMKNLHDYDEIIKIVTTAEATAIEVYNKIAKKTFGKDHDTYQLAVHIMGEEIGHEEKFENLLEKK